MIPIPAMLSFFALVQIAICFLGEVCVDWFFLLREKFGVAAGSVFFCSLLTTKQES